MAILSGPEIEKQIALGRITIDPFDPKRINPNSYNITLFNKLKVYDTQFNYFDKDKGFPLFNLDKFEYENDGLRRSIPDPRLTDCGQLIPLDMKKDNPTIEFEIPESGFVLYPGTLYLGSTNERTFTDYYLPIIDGRSSVGRLGISIHVTAGFGDTGFNGNWTLEITCVEPIKIYPNIEIGQIYFNTVEGEIKKYDGNYNNQSEPTSSRFYLGYYHDKTNDIEVENPRM